MSLTLDEVRQIRFRMTRRGESGYQVGDVDMFIDKVELTFDEFDKERERMRRELDSVQSTSVQPAVGDDSELRGLVSSKDQALAEKEQEIASLRSELDRLNGVLSQAGDSNASQQAAEGRIRELAAENDSLRSQLEQVRGEFDRARSERVTAGVSSGTQHITVTASEDAAPAVTRLLQMATDQATTLVNEAQTEATRKIAEAELRASEIKTDARTKADRVESEARVNAEQMTGAAEHRASQVDAQANQRRNELFSDLEREQAELTSKVDALRDFEAAYRSNLGGSLQRLLTTLNEDRPEPSDVPELAQGRSATPRLDALANGDNS